MNERRKHEKRSGKEVNEEERRRNIMVKVSKDEDENNDIKL